MTRQATAGDLSALKRTERHGETTIEVLVGATGSAGYLTEARILKSSGHSDLDKAAMFAVRYSEFARAACDGTSVPARIVVEVPLP